MSFYRPKILVSASNGNFDNYSFPLVRAGFEVKIGYCPRDTDCDCLLLGGGGDVMCGLYGEQDNGSHPPDLHRDICELSLLEAYHKRGKTIFGICRGMQMINVFFGGTLFGDIGHGIHNAANRDVFHRICISEQSELYDILGGEAEVNSSHHQSVKRVADGFCVTQTAFDGVTEAIESTELRAYGFQWHPERMTGRFKDSRFADTEPVFDRLLRVASET